MVQEKSIKEQRDTKIIKTKIIVRSNYIGNKNSVDAFTEIITRNINKRKLKQLEE